jgi:excisionase family DNA binding protein
MSSNIRVQKICQHCGNEFTAKTTVTQFCGDLCAKRAYKARKRAGKIEESNQETLRIISKPIEELKMKPYLSVQEACVLLGISRRTMYRMIKKGVFKVGKIGSRTLIERAGIDNLFKA